MKMRFWLPAAVLVGLGLFCYYFVYGYQFTGILLCGFGALRFAFGLLNLCRRKILGIVFNVCFWVGLAAMLVTGVWIAANQSGADQPQTQYAVVLGAGVNDTEPSQSLRERIDAAERYARAYPKSVLILSGGIGENASISEAECMYRELTARGVSANRLIKETQATTTLENLQFALEQIEARSGKTPEELAVISSEYHMLRASIIAEELEVRMLGYPAETENKLFYCNMLAREIFAVWKEIFS